MLHDSMIEVGFSNCRDEWWHYSYGDAGWAVRVGERRCFYGKVDLDPEQYLELEELAKQAMKSRTNPFLS
jgi:D-alanyl-D-alanine dipeptidase